MKKRTVLLILILLAFGLSSSTSSAQTEDIFFPETNRWVKEPFLSYYINTVNADKLFGYPITESFETNWTIVQYFQNVRLEINNLGDVIISPLGEVFYDNNEANIAHIFGSFNSNCEMESTWDFPICFGFLEYYTEFGGEAIFGKPISGLEYKGDILVQHFLNSRFEWRPNQVNGQSVSLTNLGTMFLNAIGEEQRSETIVFENDANNIFDINVWALVSKITASKGETQTLKVIVRDQNNHPVDSVNIFVNVVYSNDLDNPQQTIPIYTDSYGIAEIDFQVLGDKVGKVELIIVANYKNITKTTRSSFIIWY